MKVLKKGREQDGWAGEFPCTGRGNGNGGCGAVLLVEEDDMYITQSSHYDGSTDWYNTFKCCECGVETDLPDMMVPSQVRRKMTTRRRKRQARKRTPALLEFRLTDCPEIVKVIQKGSVPRNIGVVDWQPRKWADGRKKFVPCPDTMHVFDACELKEIATEMEKN